MVKITKIIINERNEKNSGKSENIDHLKMKLDKIYGMFK